ncbi:protein KTI12 [[Emmonsia] crescens]|uniref:Protein KTI12 n=1 Tax=[Emmonsia] crescens TaxID=73230 RepID=A0A2B7ZMK8_9EURO|nr:protein KTI12 [Emmonsia crescens]
MPLIILTGYPCSGLTYRANQLSTLLSSIQDSLTATTTSKGRYKFHIVESHDESHPRIVYDTARSEKEARAVVYGRVKRALGKDTFVIVDGMNYIKGWRYQLWCESKAAETTCCVVHVGTPIDQCVVNNESRIRKRERKGKAGEEVEDQGTHGANMETGTEADIEALSISDDEEPYPPELLQNLIFRYEEPTTHSRWDKPLFTVPWSDPTPPAEEIWTALTGIPVPKEQSATDTLSLTTSEPTSQLSTNTPSTTTTRTSTRTSLPRPKIVPHQATLQPATTDPSALHALEKCTSGIISALRTFSLENPSASAATATTATDTAKHSLGPGITISVPGAETPVFIPATALASTPTDELAGAGGILALPRLQRLRRQWVGMNRAFLGQGHARGPKGLETEQAGNAFVRFLNAEFEGMEE